MAQDAGDAPKGSSGSDDLDVTLTWPGADASDDDESDRVARVPGPDGDLDRTDFDGAAFGGATSGGDDLEDGDDLVPGVPLLPTIAGRVDALGVMLRTIAMRVDSLAATTNAFRSAVTDRIDEYADVVTGLARQSDQTLDDYRRATERTIAELRRGLADHGELLQRATGRLDELGTDVATLVDLVRQPGTGVLGEQLALLRQDLGHVRGLIDVVVDTMPASADGSATVELSSAQLDQIVERLAAWLAGAGAARPAVTPKPRAKR